MAAPLGNENASKGRRWAQALEHVASRWPDEPDYVDCSSLVRGLRMAAFEFWKKTMNDCDLGFFKEAGDRFDGKPAQTTTLTGDQDNPLALTLIERKVVG